MKGKISSYKNPLVANPVTACQAATEGEIQQPIDLFKKTETVIT